MCECVLCKIDFDDERRRNVFFSFEYGASHNKLKINRNKKKQTLTMDIQQTRGF